MFCKSKSIKCKVIIFILFILFIFSIFLGNIYKTMNNINDNLKKSSDTSEPRY